MIGRVTLWSTFLLVLEFWRIYCLASHGEIVGPKISLAMHIFLLQTGDLKSSIRPHISF